MAAEIERICNSTPSDVRAQMEQFRGITEQAIRYIESVSSRAQYDLQEASGASNTTSRDIVAPGYSGTLNMPSTPGLGPFLEYMELSTEFINGQISEVPASVLSSQDDSTLDSPYGMDTDLLGIGFQY